MKAKEFLEQEAEMQKEPQPEKPLEPGSDSIQQTMASEPIPLETAKDEFNKKVTEFEFSGISVNDIKIGNEGTTLTLQQGNVTSAVTFVWGAEDDIGPFAEIKPQQGDTINLDLTPLSPPVVDTKGTGRQIDISNLSWLTKEAFEGLMDACGFKEVPPEQEEPEVQPGEGSGAPKQTATSPAVELDAKTVPAPAPRGQPGESLSEAVYNKAVAFGFIKEAPNAWLKEEDSYSVTVQKGKDTFNVTVGGNSEADAKKKAKELTRADKVMNTSKQDKKKEMEAMAEKSMKCKKCGFVDKKGGMDTSCPKCGSLDREVREAAIDQKVDTQMKCKGCGYIGSEPSFQRDEIKGFEYTCPKCDSHDVMDAPSEINHDRMRKGSPGVEEEAVDPMVKCLKCDHKGNEEEFESNESGDLRCPECGSSDIEKLEEDHMDNEVKCKDCGFSAPISDFIHHEEEEEIECPECGSTNITGVEDTMENKNKVGLFRFIIREGKRVKIPLGEAKKKVKQPHKVVAQKPYSYSWSKKPKEEGVKSIKVAGKGLKPKSVNLPKNFTWKKGKGVVKKGESMEESKKEFFTKIGLLK